MEPTTVQGASERILSILEPQEAPPEAETATPEEEVPRETSEETQSEETQETPEEVDDGETPPEETISTLDELFEHEGYDLDQVKTLKVQVKVDGEQGQVGLKDLIDNYQMGEAGEHRLTKAKQMRQQLDDEVNQHRQKLADEYTQLNTLVDSVVSDIQSTNLDEIEDPGEKALAVQAQNQRLEKLKEVQNEALKVQRKAIKDQYHRKVQEEATKLQNLPGWDKFAETATEVRSYLINAYGMSPEEIDGKLDESGYPVKVGVIDSRAFDIARKAMLFDKASQTANPKKQKLKTLPKVGSGKPKGKDSAKVARLKQKRKAVRDSGDVRAAASLITELL